MGTNKKIKGIATKEKGNRVLESEEERIKRERREKALENRRRVYASRFPIGSKIGFLTVVEKPEAVNGRLFVACVCDCGKTKNFDLNYVLNSKSHKCGKDCESYLKSILTKRDKKKLKTVNDWLAYFRNDNNFNPPLDDKPTDAPPGSEEKKQVLQSRLERGKALFHPDDRKNYKGTKPNQFILYRNRDSFF